MLSLSSVWRGALGSRRERVRQSAPSPHPSRLRRAPLSDGKGHPAGEDILFIRSSASGWRHALRRPPRRPRPGRDGRDAPGPTPSSWGRFGSLEPKRGDRRGDAPRREQTDAVGQPRLCVACPVAARWATWPESCIPPDVEATALVNGWFDRLRAIVAEVGDFSDAASLGVQAQLLHPC